MCSSISATSYIFTKKIWYKQDSIQIQYMLWNTGGYSRLNINVKPGLYHVYNYTQDPNNPLQLYWDMNTKNYLGESITASIS